MSEVTNQAILWGQRTEARQEVCGRPGTPSHLGVFVTWQLCLGPPKHLAGQNGRLAFQKFLFIYFLTKKPPPASPTPNKKVGV